MSPVFKAVLLFAVAAVLCAATFILVPRFRAYTRDDVGDVEPAIENAEPEREADVDGFVSEPRSAGSRTMRTSRGQSLSAVGREDAGDDVRAPWRAEEMRNEVEDMIRRFRGTPEERQEVIDECEEGREFILLMAELSESSIEEMSPEELEKERENFEKEYRAQLDCLQSGRLRDMLESPEEREVIGGALETAQEFLERIDAALYSAGY